MKRRASAAVDSFTPKTRLSLLCPFSVTMATALPSSETLQLVILHALEGGPVQDSRQLVIKLPAHVDGAQAIGAERVAGPGADEQGAIKGALDSLVAREVRRSTAIQVGSLQAPPRSDTLHTPFSSI